jgi:phenylpropionate dioxygenase-like ring-hydroxylating dioxygenase large terminal subunit
MLYEEQQRILIELSAGIKSNTSADAGGIMRAPVSDFTSTALLAQEQEVFFKNTPLLMGASTDLPGPNTYVATSETGVPILMTRDSEGHFRAFMNVCRHRGVQVVKDGRGEKNRFSCPFHAWTYQNTGDLIAITREEKFGCIDKGSHGLIELPSQEALGMLWVRPSQGETFETTDLLGGLAEEMESWQIANHDFHDSQVLDADINWKLAIDTFGENYHFDILHKNTLSSDIFGNLQTHDIFGQNYRMVFASKNGFKYVEDNQMPIAEWPYRSITLNVYFVFPNVIFLVDPAGIDILRMYPGANDPGKSRTYHSRYRNPDYETPLDQAQEPAPNRFQGFNEVVVDEDYAVAASTQANASSGAVSHYLFGRNEPALHHYHNSHRRALGKELLTLEDESV